ncbi:3-methyl-2-oxobutanoate hydroxymethyltransferase [Bacteriovoracaceae bacterium]|nr:3-methyl-2-oxobutanoate hydroxymethyltransferase [Bacteriovoracaceae bacterium]
MKLNTRKIKANKVSEGKLPLQMLTCYDFQTAQLFNETEVDMLLVGDSLGNVILGYETTVEVTLEEMIVFGAAVKRGAPHKFVIVDMPFGTYNTVEDGLKNATILFQKTKAEAIKIEASNNINIKLIKRLCEVGIPVMGHIGLTPQSVHELGGYYTHGNSDDSAMKLVQQARALEAAGCFSIVLECVTKSLATEITNLLDVPTIGIGAGDKTDGQVLVTNDLLRLGPNQPPKFVEPIANLFHLKKQLISNYLQDKKFNSIEEFNESSIEH